MSTTLDDTDRQYQPSQNQSQSHRGQEDAEDRDHLTSLNNDPKAKSTHSQRNLDSKYPPVRFSHSSSYLEVHSHPSSSTMPNRDADETVDELTPIVPSPQSRAVDYQSTMTMNDSKKQPYETEALSPTSLSPTRARGAASPSAGNSVSRRRSSHRGVVATNTGRAASIHRQSVTSGIVTADTERETEEEKASWYRKVVEKFGSLELDNEGSVARDHLALERTFLAWLRTSISFASLGIAISQLFRLNTTISDEDVAAKHLRSIGKPLGATFIAVAVIVLFVGFHRYFESQHWIVQGKFPASRTSVALVSFLTGALVIISFVVIVVIAPSMFET